MNIPLKFGDTKGRERAILENRKNELFERIRRYKMGIFNSNEEIKKVEDKLKFMDKLS